MKDIKTFDWLPTTATRIRPRQADISGAGKPESAANLKTTIDPGANCRDRASYPDHGDSGSKWAWEFLRRNPAYQETWLEAERIANGIREHVTEEDFYTIKLAPDLYRYDSVVGMLIYGDLTNDERAVIREGHAVRPFYKAKAEPWGLNHLADPRESDPSWNLRQCAVQYHAPGNLRSVKIKAGEQTEGHIDFETYRHKAIIEFDLEWPLRPQIECARYALEQRQKKLKESDELKTGRLRPEKYVNYLRVLDAMSECGLSADDEGIASKVASVLAPELDNSYPTYAVNMTMKDWIKAATELRDGGYRRILTAVNPWFSRRRTGK